MTTIKTATKEYEVEDIVIEFEGNKITVKRVEFEGNGKAGIKSKSKLRELAAREIVNKILFWQRAVGFYARVFREFLKNATTITAQLEYFPLSKKWCVELYIEDKNGGRAKIINNDIVELEYYAPEDIPGDFSEKIYVYRRVHIFEKITRDGPTSFMDINHYVCVKIGNVRVCYETYFCDDVYDCAVRLSALAEALRPHLDALSKLELCKCDNYFYHAPGEVFDYYRYKNEFESGNLEEIKSHILMTVIGALLCAKKGRSSCNRCYDEARFYLRDFEEDIPKLFSLEPEALVERLNKIVDIILEESGYSTRLVKKLTPLFMF